MLAHSQQIGASTYGDQAFSMTAPENLEYTPTNYKD